MGNIKFEGKDTENVNKFIENVEASKAVNKWNDERTVKNVARRLTGRASELLQRKIRNTKRTPTWNELKEELKKEFGKSESELDCEILTAKQKEDESMKEFYYRMIDLCQERDPEMKEETICRHVVNGLADEHRNRLNCIKYMTIGDLKEAIERETYNQKIGAQKVDNSKILNEVAKMTEKIEKLAARREKEEEKTEEVINKISERVINKLDNKSQEKPQIRERHGEWNRRGRGNYNGRGYGRNYYTNSYRQFPRNYDGYGYQSQRYFPPPTARKESRGNLSTRDRGSYSNREPCKVCFRRKHSTEQCYYAKN